MNFYAIRAIYFHEMDRMRRTLFQSVLSPVLSTSLYFIVFGSVIGGMIPQIEGVSYGSFIVPGLLMLTLLTQSISNSSFGIFFVIYHVGKKLFLILGNFSIIFFLILFIESNSCFLFLRTQNLFVEELSKLYVIYIG